MVRGRHRRAERLDLLCSGQQDGHDRLGSFNVISLPAWRVSDDGVPVARLAQSYPMSRRSTPQRIDEARRAATRNRVIGERVTPETADAWIAAWEAQAAQDGPERGAAYWEAGWAWIAARRKERVRP
jgi:hypothetical protein